MSVNGPALLNTGRVNLEKKRFPQAQVALAQAVAQAPQLADAWFMLGEAEVQLKHMPAAKKAFQAYLQLQPKGEYAEEAAKQSGNENQRNENRRKRKRHRKEGKGNFACAVESGF